MGVMVMASPIEEIFTISEVAQMLRVNERTIRRWIEQEKINAIPIPGRGRGGQEWRIPRSEIERLGFKFEDTEGQN